MYLGPVCWACKYTISRKCFLLDAADERNLINFGMHFQAKLPNFEGPQWFYFVLGTCVKYRSSISSTSSLLTTPNEFNIVSRNRSRLSTVQIKCSMGFVLFLILSGRLRHFQSRRVGDSCILQAMESSPCMVRAWAVQLSVRCNYHAGHVCRGTGEQRWTSAVRCVSLRWAQCSSHKSRSRPQRQRLACGLPWHAGTHKAFILCHPSFSGLQSC